MRPHWTMVSPRSSSQSYARRHVGDELPGRGVLERDEVATREPQPEGGVLVEAVVVVGRGRRFGVVDRLGREMPGQDFVTGRRRAHVASSIDTDRWFVTWSTDDVQENQGAEAPDLRARRW